MKGIKAEFSGQWKYRYSWQVVEGGPQMLKRQMLGLNAEIASIIWNRKWCLSMSSRFVHSGVSWKIVASRKENEESQVLERMAPRVCPSDGTTRVHMEMYLCFSREES